MTSFKVTIKHNDRAVLCHGLLSVDIDAACVMVRRRLTRGELAIIEPTGGGELGFGNLPCAAVVSYDKPGALYV
jgi:hypothetical protein